MAKKREEIIAALVFAGYHGDQRAFARLVVEARNVSTTSAAAAYARGIEARREGMACGCNACK